MGVGSRVGSGVGPTPSIVHPEGLQVRRKEGGSRRGWVSSGPGECRTSDSRSKARPGRGGCHRVSRVLFRWFDCSDESKASTLRVLPSSRPPVSVGNRVSYSDSVKVRVKRVDILP